MNRLWESDPAPPGGARSPASARVWQVGALCKAVADALDARFNPVTVSGEISGFNRAASGHAYFTLKDDSGQLRCAMFRRAGGLLPFTPRDGMRVEVEGRVSVYEPRGDLQLIVESMRQAGAGALLEQFLRLKAKLEAQGLFDAARKRPVPAIPRGIGVVTSLGAAALRDPAQCSRQGLLCPLPQHRRAHARSLPSRPACIATAQPLRAFEQGRHHAAAAL